MRFPTLALLLVAVALPLAVAAPVPKVPDAELRKAFGPFVETDASAATFANGRLTLASKGMACPNFFGNDNRPAAYRTERAVKGDFTLEVTLLTASRPTQANPKDDVRVHSGVYICQGTEVVRVGKFVRVVTHENKVLHDESLWCQHDGSGSRLAAHAHDKPAEVRLVRAGSLVDVLVRTDKGDWRKRFTITTRFGDEVTVGVALMPEAAQPAEATFADFKLKAQ